MIFPATVIITISCTAVITEVGLPETAPAIAFFSELDSKYGFNVEKSVLPFKSKRATLSTPKVAPNCLSTRFVFVVFPKSISRPPSDNMAILSSNC